MGVNFVETATGSNDFSYHRFVCVTKKIEIPSSTLMRYQTS